MADVSSNDEFDMDPGEVQEDDVSSNDSSDGFEPNYQNDEDYLSYVQSEIRSDGSVDYSSGIANIENLLKFQIAIIIGFLLVVCFIIGWKHD